MEITDLFSKKNSCQLLVNLEGKLAEKYRWYREFLIHNHEALQIISDLERMQQGNEPFTMQGVKKDYHRFFEASTELVKALNELSGGRYEKLFRACEDLHQQMVPLFDLPRPRPGGELVLLLEDLEARMVDMAGSKATNLAVAGNELGLPTPQGFVVTAHAFWSFIEQNELFDAIDDMLAVAASEDPLGLESSAGIVQKRILDSPVPAALAEGIFQAYERLEAKTRKNVPIAVRSSAVGEDTEASFAGQYTTVLNVGRDKLLEAYKTVLASKYSPRAVRYRMRCGLDDMDTPMCVAGITMVDARSSGVAYSRDPSRSGSSEILVSAIWGQGEHLVSGEASPDNFFVDRKTLHITGSEIRSKTHRMVLLEEGGTLLKETPETDKAVPAIDEEIVRKVAEYSLKLEEYFGSPQDVEWCVDQSGRLFILQSRPLGLSLSRGQDVPRQEDYPGHAVLLSKGKSASRGTVSGRVIQAANLKAGMDMEDGILVAKTASPDYAKLAGSIKGIVTDLGSVASHLASVAREFGIPMIVETGDATITLKQDTVITLVADTATVYEGKVSGLEETSSLPGERVLESPVHRRMNAVMSRISPLNLTDPEAAAFTPENCRTFHDIIRFSHEKIVKEMFGLSRQASEGVKSLKMKSGIPLAIYFIDLGGGLKGDLTTCDDLTPESITSLPMKALWRGLSHPGVNWFGTVGVSSKNLMALMTSGPPPQMASYGILSNEYMNFSIKFGYHFATIDTLWTDNPEDNYISLQFGGGVGSYLGRSLRIHFLSEVLQRLGFLLEISGDVLDATMKGYDSPSMEEALDQLGRLLASSRLLDLGIRSQDSVGGMVEAFFSGDYNFLQQSRNPLPDFYTPTGDWTSVEEDGRVRFLQDGSKSGEGFSCSLKNIMGKLVGSRYQQFLDNIKAYHYFPLAIRKESFVGDAIIQVTVTPESGCLDNTAGVVFGLKNVTNFFVLSVDALENNVSLFEFVHGRRRRHVIVEKSIRPGKSYSLEVRIRENRATCFFDGETLLQFDAENPLEGYTGLWTKADTKAYFESLSIREGT
ncbi:MAG: PEP/pyruvate-binding domain-containing protein [Thermodesulfobacteriota bacterium]|nr:PEP/pyruvate-binding domain-containing protein [Thermodesulfobacteriota bacterium]